MHLTKSITDKIIRLTDERWLHIVEGHPEIAGHLHDVLLAVAAPDMIISGSADELLASVYNRNDKLLIVVYKEMATDGFIITAFFTKRIEQLLKRKILWQKQ
ncbi:MAG: hypothetical protein M9887_10620 [Chitinophagales bacterium]|nr:hypothetical protein [Chitinophagales bacterium]